MTAKPRIIVTEGLDPAPMQWLKEHADVQEIRPDAAEFGPALATANGLVVRTYTKVNGALLAKAPRLKVVGRGGVGLENIDVPACRKRGVEVVYTPDANTRAVAEFVFGYLLQLVRPWCAFSEKAYAPEQFKSIRGSVRGRQLNELTLGILGMGRVGKSVGRIGAMGFGMRVIYNDLRDVAGDLDFPATSVDKAALYRQSDVLTIHVDMRPGNAGLVGQEAIALLPKGAILVNTSRGEVLDASAAALALEQGRLTGVGLDVYAPEPPGENFPLLRRKGTVLTPHLAARTNTALEGMSWVVRDVVGVLEGKPPRYPAPAEVLS